MLFKRFNMSIYSGLVLPLLASALLQVLHVQIENSPLPLIYTKLLITNPASQLPLKLNRYQFFTCRPTARHTSWRKNAGSTCSAGSTPGNQEGCINDDDINTAVCKTSKLCSHDIVGVGSFLDKERF